MSRKRNARKARKAKESDREHEIAGKPGGEGVDAPSGGGLSAEAAGRDDAQASPSSAEASDGGGGEAELKALCAELNDKLLRTRAEFENYRKRVQREFAEIRSQTKISTVQEFLPVYDHFQMALEHASQSDDVGALRQGIELIQNEFSRTLETLGIVPLQAVGEPFNPEEHEAMAQEPSAEVPEGRVTRQWKVGFKAGERLVRPASVIVSSGLVSSDDDTEDGKKEEVT